MSLIGCLGLQSCSQCVGEMTVGGLRNRPDEQAVSVLSVDPKLTWRGHTGTEVDGCRLAGPCGWIRSEGLGGVTAEALHAEREQVGIQPSTRARHPGR